MTWLQVTTEARKFGIALLGVLASALSLGLIPDPYAKYVTVAITIATALGVYGVKNVPSSNSRQG